MICKNCGGTFALKYQHELEPISVGEMILEQVRKDIEEYEKTIKRPDSELLITYRYDHGRYDIFYKRGQQVSIYRHEAQALYRLINNPARAVINVHSFDMNSFTIHVRISHNHLINQNQRAVEARS